MEFLSVWAHDYADIAIEKKKGKNLFYAVAVNVNNQVEILEVTRNSHGWGKISMKKVSIEGIRSAVKMYANKYILEMCLPLTKENEELKFNLFRNDGASLNPFSIYTWKFTGYNFLAFEHFATLQVSDQ